MSDFPEANKLAHETLRDLQRVPASPLSSAVEQLARGLALATEPEKRDRVVPATPKPFLVAGTLESVRRRLDEDGLTVVRAYVAADVSLFAAVECLNVNSVHVTVSHRFDPGVVVVEVQP